eukprot:11226412-Lingulodinium_polyedra.AAC.1
MSGVSSSGTVALRLPPSGISLARRAVCSRGRWPCRMRGPPGAEDNCVCCSLVFNPRVPLATLLQAFALYWPLLR